MAIAQAPREASATLLLPRLRPDQWAIVQHPARIKVLAMARRYGKTTMCGATALATASQGGRVAWCVPIYKHANALWRWLKSVTRNLQSAKLAVLSNQQHVIEFPHSGGFLAVYSTVDSGGDQARGEFFDLVICEEAALQPEEAWTEVLLPTLADREGAAFLISTPRGKNWFWKEYKVGIEDGEYQASFTAPTSANPIPGIQRDFERAKRRFGEDSPTFRQEWLAEFVEDESTLFDLDWWNSDLHPGRRYDPRMFRHAHTCLGRYLSWDTALKDEKGNAYSACVVGDLMPDCRLQIREVYRERLSFPRLIAQMKRLALEETAYTADGKLQDLIIEDKASGTSAYQTLREACPELAPHLKLFLPTTSKYQRAQQAGVWCENGSVLLPYPDASTGWLKEFQDELEEAPGEYMDQVDAFAQLVIYLERYLALGHDYRLFQGDEYGDTPELVLPGGRLTGRRN